MHTSNKLVGGFLGFTMSTFDVEVFLGDPSVERLDACLKDDLYAIAAHFAVEASSSLLKAELKEVVVRLLVDNGVLGSKEEGAVGEVLVEAGAFPLDSEIKPLRVGPRLSAASGDDAGDDARLRLRLARLQFEAQEKERDAEYRHKLAIRKMELEMEIEREVRLKRLDLEAVAALGPARYTGVGPSAAGGGFDVGRNVGLVPQFREAEVDSYFSAFERVATSLRWPKEVWAILLQCRLTGKAQEVLSALSLEDCLSYEAIKAAVLRAYELVDRKSVV